MCGFGHLDLGQCLSFAFDQCFRCVQPSPFGVCVFELDSCFVDRRRDLPTLCLSFKTSCGKGLCATLLGPSEREWSVGEAPTLLKRHLASTCSAHVRLLAVRDLTGAVVKMSERRR